MKVVGIVGGIAPESTIDYYRSVVATYRARVGGESYPQVLINSIDLTGMLALIADRPALADLLVREVERLARAGADFAVMASNTPHLVFEEVSRRSPIPMISIVEATCAAAQERGMKTVGLFGTRFTMDGGFYPSVFCRQGISVVLPEPEEQTYIHERYMGELVKGVFAPETLARLVAIVDRLRERHGIEGLILGGTELPLALRDHPHSDVPYLDTTSLHVDRIVAALLA